MIIWRAGSVDFSPTSCAYKCMYLCHKWLCICMFVGGGGKEGESEIKTVTGFSSCLPQQHKPSHPNTLYKRFIQRNFTLIFFENNKPPFVRFLSWVCSPDVYFPQTKFLEILAVLFGIMSPWVFLSQSSPNF